MHIPLTKLIIQESRPDEALIGVVTVPARKTITVTVTQPRSIHIPAVHRISCYDETNEKQIEKATGAQIEKTKPISRLRALSS